MDQRNVPPRDDLTGIPFDGRTIVKFRITPPEELPDLNRELGMQLDPGQFELIKRYCNEVQRRDPTVGEVRMFDILDRLTRHTLRRIAPDALYTDSEDISAVWADILARRHALAPEDRTHCTLAEILPLIGEYMERTASPSAEVPADSRLRGKGGQVPKKNYSLPAQTNGRPVYACAMVKNLRPCGRLTTVDPTGAIPDGVNLLCANDTSGRTAYPASAGVVKDGDILVCLRHVDTYNLSALQNAMKVARLKAVGITVLTGQPLPLAVLSLCNGNSNGKGIDIALKNLMSYTVEEESPVRRFCTVESENGAEEDYADYIISLRGRDVKSFLQLCRGMKLGAAVFGRVNQTGHFRLLHGLTPLVDVNCAFLRTAIRPVPYIYQLPVPVQPEQPPVRIPWLVCTRGGSQQPEEIPSAPLVSENAIYMNGDHILISAAMTALPDAETAYMRAKDTLLAAVVQLCAQGISRKDIRLSVLLSYPPTSVRRDGIGDPVLFSALCGLYRAAVELCIPLPEVAQSVGASSLSLKAYAPKSRSTEPNQDKPQLACIPGHKLYLYCAPDGISATSWEAWRQLLDAISSSGKASIPLCYNGITPLALLSKICPAGVTLHPDGRALMEQHHLAAVLAASETALPAPAIEVGVFTEE